MSKLKNILSLALISGTICVSPALADGESNTSTKGQEAFSGVYNDYTMATKCQKSAEEIVKNPQELRNCIDHLALKRRNSNAEISREGLKDLQEIKFDQLQHMMAFATQKGAIVADYYAKTAEETADANSKAKTTADVDSSAINTNAVLTSVVNSMRDLYAEQLKYLAISNIENVEKDVLEEVASLEALNAAKKPEQTGGTASSGNGDAVAETGQIKSVVRSETPASTLTFKDGVCARCITKDDGSSECRAEECPDGEYYDQKANVYYVCLKGICEIMEGNNSATKKDVNTGGIVFNADGRRKLGWNFIGGTCEYCKQNNPDDSPDIIKELRRGIIESGGSWDAGLSCSYEHCPPDGQYSIANDNEYVIVCEDDECKKVKK